MMQMCMSCCTETCSHHWQWIKAAACVEGPRVPIRGDSDSSAQDLGACMEVLPTCSSSEIQGLVVRQRHGCWN